ncbi:MAG: Xaa-Pro peptidase family protein [Pseudomonadota bacterium]
MLSDLSPELSHAHERACRYRLARVKQILRAQHLDAILLYDPLNIRYATETTNMQVWTAHNPERYALVFADGPVILFEFHHCEHLHDGNTLVDEIRDAVSFTYFSVGPNISSAAKRWANHIREIFHSHVQGPVRLAVDKCDYEALKLLESLDVQLFEGHSVMEEARLIKSADEITLMLRAIAVAETGIQRMYDELQPGMRENELWAWLHYENIRQGGEWIETRLLSSGPRTNPWMRECSDRIMQKGEMLSFDTDLIGPFGYCADISRAWTIGHTAPTPEQCSLYRMAHSQIQHNIALLRPDLSFRELSEKAWAIPDKYFANRYCCILHGVGLCDEYPAIAHQGGDWERTGYDGALQQDMVVCVESYIGAEGGGEGVKLEQQVLITDQGPKELSTYPWNDDWL